MVTDNSKNEKFPCDSCHTDCCSGIPSEIMGIDEDIDFVGFYHNHDFTIEDDFNEDLKSYFEDSETIQNSNQVLITKRNQGPIHYAMEKQEGIVRYTFGINNNTLLLISTDSKANSDLVISRIIDYLKHQNNQSYN